MQKAIETLQQRLLDLVTSEFEDRINFRLLKTIKGQDLRFNEDPDGNVFHKLIHIKSVKKEILPKKLVKANLVDEAPAIDNNSDLKPK